MAQIQVFLSEENPTSHELIEDKITVGRLADNSISIVDDSVSSHHAELYVDGDNVRLQDLDSTNGTFVNGERVGEAILRHGDEVRFGSIRTIFHGQAEASSIQPPPEAAVFSAQPVPSEGSRRPENFVSTSPIPKNVVKKDWMGLAAIIVTILAVLSFAGAVTCTFMLIHPAA
jgi:pSer/pThr/pTyr-binding forkhead associated (FHA) protein